MKHAAARLSAEAQACLLGYPWPGNVRELDNAIQRALILQQGGLIQPEDFCLGGPLACAPLPAVAPVVVATMRSAPVEAEVLPAESAGALGDDLRRREFQMIIDTQAERPAQGGGRAPGYQPANLALQVGANARCRNGCRGVSVCNMSRLRLKPCRFLFGVSAELAPLLLTPH